VRDWKQRAFVELAVACAVTLFLFALRPVSAACARHSFWKPIAALGTVSYSLYLVHPFNLNVVGMIINKAAPAAPLAVKLPAMVALQILIAAVFWYWCERPFLNRQSSSATPKAHSMPLPQTGAASG